MAIVVVVTRIGSNVCVRVDVLAMSLVVTDQHFNAVRPPSSPKRHRHHHRPLVLVASNVAQLDLLMAGEVWRRGGDVSLQ